jgi:hypothetical protein
MMLRPLALALAFALAACPGPTEDKKHPPAPLPPRPDRPPIEVTLPEDAPLVELQCALVSALRRTPAPRCAIAVRIELDDRSPIDVRVGDKHVDGFATCDRAEIHSLFAYHPPLAGLGFLDSGAMTVYTVGARTEPGPFEIGVADAVQNDLASEPGTAKSALDAVDVEPTAPVVILLDLEKLSTCPSAG